MVVNIVEVGWATSKSGCLPITDGDPDPDIPFLGIFVSKFRYFVFAVRATRAAPPPWFVLHHLLSAHLQGLRQNSEMASYSRLEVKNWHHCSRSERLLLLWFLDRSLAAEQCCGSGSGIRCLFDLWIRDLGSGIGFFRIPDLRSRIPDLRSRIPNPYF